MIAKKEEELTAFERNKKIRRSPQHLAKQVVSTDTLDMTPWRPNKGKSLQRNVAASACAWSDAIPEKKASQNRYTWAAGFRHKLSGRSVDRPA